MKANKSKNYCPVCGNKINENDKMYYCEIDGTNIEKNMPDEKQVETPRNDV